MLCALNSYSMYVNYFSIKLKKEHKKLEDLSTLDLCSLNTLIN